MASCARCIWSVGRLARGPIAGQETMLNRVIGKTWISRLAEAVAQPVSGIPSMIT